jgi:SAM-dependent methyltransferase
VTSQPHCSSRRVDAPEDRKYRDLLWQHLLDLPYFRALLRAVEARFYQDIILREPVLDLGCGDGHFASLAFDRPLDIGIDRAPLQEAARRGVYRMVVQGDAASMPFPDGYFNSAVSNSALEHMPRLDAALAETARVLRPGAQFVLCVPNHNFLPSLSVARGLERVKARSLARAYRNFFNRISRHYHCDPPQTWILRLDQAGFEVERWWHYFAPNALAVMEWGHYLGAPALISRKLTGRWVLFPGGWSRRLIYGLLRHSFEQSPICDNGVYSFYVTRRKNMPDEHGMSHRLRVAVRQPPCARTRAS